MAKLERACIGIIEIPIQQVLNAPFKNLPQNLLLCRYYNRFIPRFPLKN